MDRRSVSAATPWVRRDAVSGLAEHRPRSANRRTLELYHIRDRARTTACISATFAPSARARRRGAPGCHQTPATLEKVGAVARGRRLVAESVRERHLGNLGREGALSRPIAENSTYLTAKKFVGFTVGIPGLILLNSGLQSNS